MSEATLIENIEQTTVLEPEVQELASKSPGFEFPKLPYIIKNAVLMAPGVWNDAFYSKEENIKAYHATDWTNRDNIALFRDHADRSTSQWIGEVHNHRLNEETGYVYGDLHIYDLNDAIKFHLAKPRSGVSPKVAGELDGVAIKNYTFKNFSWVVNPAIKKAFLYNSEGGITATTENKISALETKRKQLGMSLSEFYAIPREPAADSKLPIFDASHVRNAFARINQIAELSQDEKDNALKKIELAAKKFGVDVSDKEEGQKGGHSMAEKETKAEGAKATNVLADFNKFVATYAAEHPSATPKEAMDAFNASLSQTVPAKEATATVEAEDEVVLSEEEKELILSARKKKAGMPSESMMSSILEENKSLKQVVATMSQKVDKLLDDSDKPVRGGTAVTVELSDRKDKVTPLDVDFGMADYLFKTSGGAR